MSNRRPYDLECSAWSMLGFLLCAAFSEPDRVFAGPAFTERAEFGAGFTLSVAWGDFDADGDMDLAVGNQQQAGDTGSELYVNNGDGTFTGRSEFGRFATFALAWGDFNNDGDLDMAVANGGTQANQLYTNNGNGTFTGQARFGTGPAIGIAWADFDLDGDLDLAVGRGILGNNQQNRLYVNNANGTFTQRDEFGINQTDTVAWGDFDNDGDPDLAVGNGGFNSLQQNCLYVNNGDGTFTERAEFGTGDTATMDWGDHDNDGDLDLAVGNWENSDSYLYVNNGDTTFTEQLQFGARDTNTISWGDYDLDGDLDLAVGNGDFSSADQAYLYVNNGDGSFAEQVEFGLGSTDGVAWADFDGDGDLDLAFGNEHTPQQNYLYVNNLGGGTWLSLHLIGHFHDHGSGHSNRDAVGAKVSVFEPAHLGDPAFLLGYREVSAHGGFASQNPLDPHFGLPGQALVDVRIVWPGSAGTHITTDLTDVAVNQRLVVDEAPPLANIEEVIPDPQGGKNRSISFTVPAPVTATGSAGQRAIRVTLVDLQHPAPRNLPQFPPSNFTAFDTALDGTCVGGQYTGHHCHDDADCAGLPSGTCSVGAGCTAFGESNGCARWVGPPQTFLESNELPDRGSFRGARLQCTPYYRDWSLEGLVHVISADILPSSTYSVEVLPVECKGNESNCTVLSDPVTIATRRAGDVSAPFNPPDNSSQPNGVDIANLVNKFRSQFGAPTKAASLLQPNAADFTADVSSLDVAVTVEYFRFKPYALSGPCPCPSTVPCNVTVCTTAGPCPTLYGAGALCIQTCSGGPDDGQPCSGDKYCNLCSGGSFNGLPCDPAAANPCPGGDCPPQGNCPASGFCRDRCARCGP